MAGHRDGTILIDDSPVIRAGDGCAWAEPTQTRRASGLKANYVAAAGRAGPGLILMARAWPIRGHGRTEVWKVLPDLSAALALQWLDQECNKVRRGESRATPSQTRFANYAVSLLDRKIRARDIKSEAGIRKWKTCLQRLSQSHLAELFIERMRAQDFTRWRDDCATLVAEGRYSPVTMNTDLSVLRVIMTSAKVELGLLTNSEACSE